MKTKGTVYVDFDGTIVDVMPRYFGILSSYLKNCGLDSDALDFDRYKALKRQGVKDHLIVRELCHDFEIDISKYSAFKRSSLEDADRLAMDTVIGAPEKAYEKLKSSGYRVVLLTQRYSRTALMQQIRQLGLEVCFDGIVVVEPLEGRNAKLEYLRSRVSEGDAIIGDSGVEAEAAGKLGLQGFFVLTGLRCESFKCEGSRVFSDYNAAADFLAGQLPEEGR